jgi:hypothetical protein
LEAYQAQLLLAAGNPDTPAAPMWRRVKELFGLPLTPRFRQLLSE